MTALVPTLLLSLALRAETAPEAAAEPVPDWRALHGRERRLAWRRTPVDPRYEQDFSAFTVGRHRVRLGLLSLDFGLLDNLQVGTSPALDALGVWNVDGKVTAVQTEHLAASFAAQGLFWKGSWGEDAEDLSVTAWPLETTLTWVIVPKLSLHLGYRWENLDLHGTFDAEDLASALASTVGLDLSDQVAQALEGQGTFYGGGHVCLGQGRLAADWRLNRRDSLILQVWRYNTFDARIDAGAELGEGTEAGAAVRIDQPLEGLVGAASSLSYQLTWPRFRLRVGLPLGGKDALPLLWIPQAFELYWIF